jgi:hypothetical protein
MVSTRLHDESLPATRDELRAWATERSRAIQTRLAAGVHPDAFASLRRLQSAYDAVLRAISFANGVSNSAPLALNFPDR